MARLVHIRHETEDLTEYDSTGTDSGDLSVTAAAGLAGTGFGLQCVMDDTTTLFAQADFTVSTSDLRFRFYFDPNGITMANGDLFNIATVRVTGSPFTLSSVRLRTTSGQLELQVGIFSDVGQIAAHIENITDEPHYVEIHLEKASTESASDGQSRIWLDGVLIDTQASIDSFDVWPNIKDIQLGANGIDAGTSGTFFLDELIIRDDDTEIGAFVPPTSVGRIVHIRHETGDLTEYTSTATDSGDLSVTAEAGLAGTGFGLQLVIDDTTVIFGVPEFTQLTGDDYRIRFYVDPNSLTMADGDSFYLVQFLEGSTGRDHIRLAFSTANGYAISAFVKEDSLLDATMLNNLISDAPHYIEMRVTRATTEFASDGTAELFIDGVSVDTLSGLDIFDISQADKIRFGAALQLDSGTSGTFFMDELIIRDDDTEIGAYVTPTPLGEIANIDHEGGGLSEYDSTVIDGGDLSAEIAAGLAGTRFGLQCVIDDTTQIYGDINLTPGILEHYRFRLYFDPNSMTIASGNGFIFVQLLRDGGNTVFSLRIDDNGGQFQVQSSFNADGNTAGGTDAFTDVGDGENYIEVHVQKATTEFASDGRFRTWLNGILIHDLTSQDIYDDFEAVIKLRIGAVESMDAGTSGAFYMDQLIVRDDAILIGLHMSGLGSFRGAVASAASSSDATAIDATSRDAGA